MKLLPPTAFALSLLVSCSSSKTTEQDDNASEPIAEVTVPVTQQELEEMGPPEPAPTKLKVPQNQSLFVDPRTHDQLMGENEKKTVYEIPESPTELPEQKEESGIIAIPPIPAPPVKVGLN